MSKGYKSKKIQLDEISRTWTESLQSLLELSPKAFSTSISIPNIQYVSHDTNAYNNSVFNGFFEKQILFPKTGWILNRNS